MYRQPMISGFIGGAPLIAKQLRVFTIVIHHKILPAVIVVIADG